MSKEMIEKSKEWLSNMVEILLKQTDEESRIHVKERIETQKWLIKQAERVEELESKLDRIRFVNSDYDKQNKRYREYLERIRRVGITNSPISYESFLANEALEGESDE